jgi:hypothetical protein
MKNLSLLLLCLLVFPEVFAQDLNFSTATPTWNDADVSKTYNNIGTPSIATVAAAYSGDLIFAGLTFPRPSLSGLRTQMNFTDNTQKVVFTVTFSSPVSALSFNISEIDKASNNVNYIDRVIVTGFSGVTPVNPVISNLSSHASAVGNVITGVDQDATSTPTTISFPSNVDRLVIEYDNAPGTQANPSNQEINIGNMSWDVPLPVTLIGFSARSDRGKTHLEWTTSSEENNAYFDILRTRDFKTLEKVGYVSGVGNSNVRQQYTWTDETPLSGTSYYRLEQVDFDGTTSHSKWLVIKAGNAAVEVFPNPVTEGFYLKSEEQVAKLYLMNLSGKTLKEYPAQHYYSGLSQLQSGTYLIKAVMNDGNVIWKKIVR